MAFPECLHNYALSSFLPQSYTWHPLSSRHWSTHAWESSNQGLSTCPVPGTLSSASCVPAHCNLTTALSYIFTSKLRRLRLKEMKRPRQSYTAGSRKEQGVRPMHVILEACVGCCAQSSQSYPPPHTHMHTIETNRVQWQLQVAFGGSYRESR